MPHFVRCATTWVGAVFSIFVSVIVFSPLVLYIDQNRSESVPAKIEFHGPGGRAHDEYKATWVGADGATHTGTFTGTDDPGDWGSYETDEGYFKLIYVRDGEPKGFYTRAAHPVVGGYLSISLAAAGTLFLATLWAAARRGGIVESAVRLIPRHRRYRGWVRATGRVVSTRTCGPPSKGPATSSVEERPADQRLRPPAECTESAPPCCPRTHLDVEYTSPTGHRSLFSYHLIRPTNRSTLPLLIRPDYVPHQTEDTHWDLPADRMPHCVVDGVEPRMPHLKACFIVAVTSFSIFLFLFAIS